MISEDEQLKKDFWKEYYALAKEAPPAKILRVALDKYLPSKKNALDIGAGHLVESVYLMKQGFEVTAIDDDSASLELAKTIPPTPLFHFVSSKIQDADLSANHFSLVCALNVLSHIPPNDFELALQKSKACIAKKGIFVGNFFGIRDEWYRKKSSMTFVSLEEVRSYFSDFEILFLGEREFEDTFGWAQIKKLDLTKHWHIITIIAQKK